MYTETLVKSPLSSKEDSTKINKTDLSKAWEQPETSSPKYLNLGFKQTVVDSIRSFETEELYDEKDLTHIHDEISYSHHLIDLPDDWDEQGASSIDSYTYQAAIDFLLMYARYLLDEKDLIIEAPEINPTRSGTVDLAWSTGTARMLINIRRKDDEMTAYYYGDLKNDRDIIKGSVSVKRITKSLASWMENLRK